MSISGQEIRYGESARSEGVTRVQAGSPPPNAGAYAWLVAIVVFGSGLFLINQTAVGKTIIYYSVLLMILFTMVTQYQFVTDALSPLTRGQSLNAPRADEGIR